MTMTVRPYLRENFAAQESAQRRAKLDSLETILSDVRLAAGSIDEPVRGYFIAMAIAEIRGMMRVDQETPSPQDGRKSSKFC